jgi:hypothetical protein
MARKPAPAVGKIHKAETLFFRVEVGEATGDHGRHYELTISAGSSAPIVHSKTTGKWFTLSWQDIIALAIQEGIDKS